MTPKHLHIIWGLVALLLVTVTVLAMRELSRGDKAEAHAQQVYQDVKPTEQAAVQKKEQAVQAEQINQQDLAKALEAIARKKEQPIDYSKIDDLIQQRLKGVQATSVPGATPDSPGTVTLKGKDVDKQLRDFALDCDLKAQELGSCKKSTDNLQAQLEAQTALLGTTKQKLKAKEDEVTDLKGGSFLKRVGRGLHHSACGGAGAAAGVGLSQRGQATTAAAIGAGLWLGCELVTR